MANNSSQPAHASRSDIDGHVSQTLAAYERIEKRRWLMIWLMLVVIIIACSIDFISGPSDMGLVQLFSVLMDPHGSGPSNVIVWDIRFPQALMALAVGAALGLAGAEMQTILNNPLASPFTLGLSSAAAFGASLVMILNISIPGVDMTWMIAISAFCFSLLSALLLNAISQWGGINSSGVILFGIALVFSFNALLSLIQYVASAEALQGLVFWTMGSLSRTTWLQLGTIALILLIIFPLSIRDAWQLTALRLGEERASSFGINLKKLRHRSLIRISILAAVAVSFVGTIGFIGLVAPHISRIILGEDHRYYLPGSALIGAIILSLASYASKTIIPGIIMPVGIVTSLVGIPFFLMVILRRKMD